MKKILLLLSLSFGLFASNQIQVGSSLNDVRSYKFETPTGRKMKVPNKSKLIIVAFEKDTGALVNEYLSTKEPQYLVKRHSIYIADIHKMPTIITNMFALPKLRKYKHLIYLHYDEDFQEIIPNKEEQVTLLYIENKKIVKISFIKTTQELQTAIEKQ